MTPLIKVKNITKKFGDLVAVNNVSFEVGKGEILGLLGPNGAGKTTTIQMLLGLITPDEGLINILGKNFLKNRVDCLRSMNFSSAYVDLPRRLTVWENLSVFARLYEVKDYKTRIGELLKLFEVSGLLNKRVYTLSSGQITRVYLCKAFINRPKFLLLDEPTVSLDPDLADKVRKYIRDITKKEGVSVLFTSHNMAEVTEVCDRVIFLDKGKIIAKDTPLGLANRIKFCKVRFLFDEKREVLVSFCKRENIKYSWEENIIVVEILEKDLGKLLKDLAKSNLEFLEINIEKPTLKDFFIKIARG